MEFGETSPAESVWCDLALIALSHAVAAAWVGQGCESSRAPFNGREMGLVHSSGTNFLQKRLDCHSISRRQISLILWQTLNWTLTYSPGVYILLRTLAIWKEIKGGRRGRERKRQVCVWTWSLSTSHLDPARAPTYLKGQYWINGRKLTHYLC